MDRKIGWKDLDGVLKWVVGLPFAIAVLYVLLMVLGLFAWFAG